MPEERKLVSLVFADVVSSTAWGAQHDPEFVRSVMGRYFERMKAIAETHGGTVEKFIGDAVMVVFGVPRLHEDDAERAVRTALAMHEAVTELDRELGIALALRIGVNSGEVVSGAGEERQFLVTGDAVNVVARLQTGAEPHEIVVGALTERLTRDAIEYEPRPPITAKGKSEPVRAFRAVRARSARPQSQRTDPALVAAFVGRARELGQLLDAYARAREERSGYVLTVVGNAGVGKSRLVGEALARLAQDPGVRILKGRCLPYGAGITYWPLMDLVREDAGIRPSDDRAAAMGKLSERLAALLPSDRLTSVHARIALLLGLESADAVLPNVPGDRVAVEISWGLRQYLEAVALSSTLVIVIDDLQWAEAAVVDILAQVPDPSAGVPLLMICVGRPELLERYPSWSTGRLNASILPLEPLAEDDTRTLLSRLLGSDDVPAAIRTRIAERSAGNPLFCEEFIRMLIEAGHLEFDGARWRSTHTSSDLPVPESIQAVVAARIDGLPPGEKATLQRASVIGERFALDELLALDGEIGTAPEALIRRAFFVTDRDDPSGRSLRFKHLLIRDVAYASLSKADRAALHERVGGRLEATMRDRQEEFSGLIAHHAERAYRLTRELRLEGEVAAARTAHALRWSALAGDRALTLYATEQAASHYALAIEIGRLEGAGPALLQHLYVARGRALELRGAYDEAISAYEDLEGLAAELGDDRLRADALTRQASIFRTPTTRFDAVRAVVALDAALQIARALGDPLLIAELRRDQLHIHLFRGQVVQAVQAGEESLAAAREGASQEQLMYTFNDIVCAYRESGEIVRSRAAAARAADLAEEVGNQPIAANSRSTRALVEFMDGNYDAALRLLGEASGIAERIDNAWGRSMSLAISGLPKFERGEFGETIQAMEESLSLAVAAGFLVAPAMYRAHLAWCYRAAGAYPEAVRHLAAADALVESRFPFWRAWTLGHLSRAATASGELESAGRYLELARERLSARTEMFAFQHAHVGLAAAADALVESRFPFWRAWTLGHLSRAATASGELDAAGRYLEQARELLSARTEMFAFQHAHVGLAAAELKLAQSDYAGAAAEARVWGEEQRALMRPYVADFEYVEGEALRLSGDLAVAGETLSRASATARALGGRRILWRILASRATMEEARGRNAAAAGLREEAGSILAGIESSLDLVGLSERFRAQADVRDIMGALERAPRAATRGETA